MKHLRKFKSLRYCAYAWVLVLMTWQAIAESFKCAVTVIGLNYGVWQAMVDQVEAGNRKAQ